jgi:hypothetical protein
MTSENKNLFGKCYLCEYSGRSDHLNEHIATMHPGKQILAAPPSKFMVCPGKPNLLVMVERYKPHGKEESNVYRWGYCYGCNKQIKTKGKATLTAFEVHVCKPKQVRTKKVKAEDGKVERVVANTIRIVEVEKMFKAVGFPVEYDDISEMDIKESLKATKEELGKGLSAPTEDIITRLKKEPRLKALDIERREKEAIACYAARNADTSDVDSDEEEEPYDGYSNVLVPLLYNMIGAVKKSSHQHDTIAEQRIELLQKDAELDNMKEEILRLKKIIEHQSFR